MTKRLKLDQINLTSFVTADEKIKGGATYANCGTIYQNCDTANPDNCTAMAYCSNAANCTGNCTYLC